MQATNPPVVLCFSALDPSGGGGLQADIETLASMGCHCAPIATALCATGSGDLVEAVPIDSPLLIEQARSVLEDMEVRAFKVGFAGSVANVEAIHSILQDYPQIPVLLHPAFCLWDPDNSEQADLPSALTALLLPLVEVAVVSLQEAHVLVKESDTVDATAQAITSKGCRHLLLNPCQSKEAKTNAGLYDTTGLVKSYEWTQASPSCHGATSTLTSAIAGLRAHDCPVQAAVEQAQNYTWQAMAAARQLGFGRPTPHRLFWADKNLPQDDYNPSLPGIPTH
jgi:hydroxymethylpyrimidine/phosphomethylpyrimidine kinase